MAEQRAYLDYNASAPILDEARAAMVAALEMTGNASSVHQDGRALRSTIEQARREVAALCNSAADRVIFTSGASEAASTLLTPRYRMGRADLRPGHLYVLASDHACIVEGGQFAAENISQIKVSHEGIINLDDLDRLLDAHIASNGPPIVACHQANNETGVIQPVDQIGVRVKSAGGIFIVDSAQAAGRIAVDLDKIGCDFIMLSSHKMGGPKGAGAIVAASDLLMPAPLVRGGGQEKGRRAGTENIAAIAGFGAAARIARERTKLSGDLADLRDQFEAVLEKHIADVVIFGREAPRLPNTILFSVPGLKAETVQIMFDLAGISLSAGSACSSGKIGDSHVLEAMGFGDFGSGLRVSIGFETSKKDLVLFEAAIKKIAGRRSKRSVAA